MKNLIALVILVLASLACGLQTQAVSPTTTPTTEQVRHMTDESRTLTICNTPYLNVRAGAGVEFARLDDLKDGQAVEYISETYSTDNAVWFVVRYNGRDGYINSRYVCE